MFIKYKRIKLLLSILLGILLTSCAPTVNKNVKLESFVFSKNDREYPCINVYYNDVKYVEPKFSMEYYRYLTENDIILYKQNNFPMAGTTHVYTKEIENPDYLFITHDDYVEADSYGIYFREDVDISSQVFIYQDIEIQLYNEFILVDEELNEFLYSLFLEEMDLVSVYDGNDFLFLTMKNYPEISYLIDSLRYYNGKYYEFDRGSCYQVSENMINLLIELGFISQ